MSYLFKNNKIKKSSFRRRGAASLEFAIVAPFLFLLIFGAIELARMMMIKQALTNASREAGRTAALITTQNDSRADTAARERLKGTIYWVSDPARTRITISPPITSSISSGTPIEVVVEVDCEDVSWIPPFFFAGAKIQGNCTTFRE